MIMKNAPLAQYTCFGVGGVADILAIPESIDELEEILRNNPTNIPITILGGCSNVLINDNGIRGLVILTTQIKDIPQIDGERIKCLAGVGSIFISHFAVDNGLSGLEFLCGIPGTLGGAIYGNAGAYGGAMSDIVESIDIMDYKGNIKTIPAAQLGFAYRAAKIPENTIIISAVLKLKADNKENIKNKMDLYKEQRMAKQPVGRTCGSLFKNPSNDFAARLIEATGWKGKEINGAIISEKHANFLMNTGGATAHDLESLGNMIHNDVLSKFGIDLDWEIKRI